MEPALAPTPAEPAPGGPSTGSPDRGELPSEPADWAAGFKDDEGVEEGDEEATPSDHRPRHRRRRRKPTTREQPGERIESAADVSRAVGAQKRTSRRALWLAMAAGSLVAGLSWGGRSWYHARQSRAAEELSRQIAARVAEADWRQAAALGERYLQLRPYDQAAQLERARHFGLAATTSEERRQAVELYAETLSAVGENVELRGRLASLLWDLGWVAEADQQAQRLLLKEPHSPLGWRIRAQAALQLAEQGQGDFAAAVDLATQALAHDKANLPLAETVTAAYRERLPQRDPQESGRLAEEIWGRFLTANPHLPRAWLARYRDRLARRHPDADTDLDQALRLAPLDGEILVAAGQRALDRRQLDQAEEYFSRAAELAPDNGWAALGCGDVAGERGQPDAALEWWRRVATSADDELAWEVLTRRCAAARDAGQTAEAGVLLAELHAILARNESRLSPRQLAARRAQLAQGNEPPPPVAVPAGEAPEGPEP